jgi:beta-mannanase
VTGLHGAAVQGSPIIAPSSTPSAQICLPRREHKVLPTPLFGAYDPRRQLLDEGFQVEAIYTGLYSADLSALPARLQNIYAADRIPMITVEPWPLNEPGVKADDVLSDIVAGRYDAPLQSLAATLNDCAGQAFIRFGQEMEIPELYPWYSQQPERYIAAYRYVYRMLNAQVTTEMTWIWSPAGNFTADLYYPGADVVDYVGFTLLGSHEFDRLSGALLRRSFEQLMDEKHRRMQQFGKPLIVAELGVSGSSELQVDWLRDMFASLDDYPDVHGLIYYNDFNAINRLVANPPDYKITAGQWHDSGGHGGQTNPVPAPSPIPTVPITPPAGTPMATLEE